MATIWRLGVILLAVGLCLGMTVKPPANLERNIDEGSGVLSPVPGPIMPAPGNLNPTPTPTPSQFTPSPLVTESKPSLLTPAAKAKTGGFPIWIVLVIVGALVLVYLILSYIDKKRTPEF